MTPKSLKDLFAFAKVKGLTSMIEIVEAFMKTKRYRRPRVEINVELYKKREMSYAEMQEFIDYVIRRKERIHKIFNDWWITFFEISMQRVL